MNKEIYDKIGTVVPMANVIDGLMAQLKNAVEDATTQAENGSQLCVALATGRIAYLVDDLFNAWQSVKEM